MATTETVNYTMEKNETLFVQEPSISLQTGSGIKNITQFGSIDEIVRALPKGMAYKRMYLKGFNGEALLLTQSIVKRDGKNTSSIAYIYTAQNGHIYYLGKLVTGDQNYPLRKDDGIIYASNKFDYNTFYVESDGTKMFEKDRLNYGSAQGFTRDENKNYTWHEIGTAFNKTSKEHYQKKNNSIPVINFDIK